ncbi:hypothetical protein ACFPFV_01270 [Salinicoccus siamensis]|uniref:hypothetical protein n=1 Tax=Salinicoccus siamensis TaxID=381830 RepID=UPI00360D672B
MHYGYSDRGMVGAPAHKMLLKSLMMYFNDCDEWTLDQSQSGWYRGEFRPY